jgi:sulfatase modifying factor 1
MLCRRFGGAIPALVSLALLVGGSGCNSLLGVDDPVLRSVTGGQSGSPGHSGSSAGGMTGATRATDASMGGLGQSRLSGGGGSATGGAAGTAGRGEAAGGVSGRPSSGGRPAGAGSGGMPVTAGSGGVSARGGGGGGFAGAGVSVGGSVAGGTRGEGGTGASSTTGGTAGITGGTMGSTGGTVGSTGGTLPGTGGLGGTGGSTDAVGGESAAGGIGGSAPSVGGSAPSVGGSAPSVGGSPPSCSAQGSSCLGGLTCNGESCCTSLLVPGGSYLRGGAYLATVSNFCLDKYEVTVGRFRKFVAAYNTWILGHPVAGAGEHVPGAGTGWQTAWAPPVLPADAVTLQDANHLQCSGTQSTWTGGDDNRPINCVSWYEAFAFCIWDEGRLATEAEWEYAAGHGDENRTYPWGIAPEPSSTYAVFATSAAAAVGSVPAGNGYWGQADLAGNVFEWVFDWYGDPYVTPWVDRANTIQTTSYRVYRGGAYYDPATDVYNLAAAFRGAFTPEDRSSGSGIRCARAPQ